ncbi:trypsin-like serine protease [Aquihabitans daechungensis]|uniref:trypsin-like serine protease n=1 Tax=Aquihabitans daechungensis TaxID=1052257 RepID=UPI003BA03742
MLRRTLPVLACAALAVGLALPASAQQAEEPPPQPQIVGGTIAPPGAYGWTAALIRRGASRTSGFSCGAVVLSRSWVLTAGHCLLDYDGLYPDATYGNYVGPSYYDVLTGTQSLSGSGGQRLQVVAVHPHPSYDYVDSDYDLALLRVSRPTTAEEISVIGSSPAEQALDDAGVTATVSGWGTTSSGGSVSTSLRSVDVPIQSNATCTNAYPPGFTDQGDILEYHASNMICAGPLSGGKDSCQGDSGGPLAVPAGDASWRLVGTVSFGLGCARAGYPGVYQRLTATSSWIGSTRRFGPFNPDGSGYVARQFVDFAGRFPTASEASTWVNRLKSSPPADIITSLQAAPAWDGNAGMNARLYRAAYLRNPDTSGFDYWVRKRWAGSGPVSIANHFASSSEFKTKYGSLSTNDFVTRIYQNVFERNPDPGGRTYWVNKLNGGAGRGQMLYELSNSSEYRNDTATLVRIITTRFGLLREVPSAGEITSSQALSQRSLIDTLRTSLRYASRFTG